MRAIDPIYSVRRLREALPALPLGAEEPGVRLAMARKVMALAADDPAWRTAARSMAAWNWARAPLDLSAVQTMQQVAGPEEMPTLQVLAKRLDASLDVADTQWQALLESGRHAAVIRSLAPRLSNPATGLAWLARCWDYLLRLNQGDLPLSFLAQVDFTGIEPVRRRLEAEWAFFALAPDQAMEKMALHGLFSAWGRFLQAECLLRMGETDAAAEILLAVRRELPWHPNIACKLFSLRQKKSSGLDPETAAATCILIYSWNKRAILEETLKSLAASHIGDASVLVLDNGSGDGTDGMLREATSLFAAGRFETVRLPVNIGAPAARNWLLSIPRVRQARYAAFLDDDVILPRQWLGVLLDAARRADPSPGAVGCRIVSAEGPAALQSADYHLLTPRPGLRTFRDADDHVLVHDNCAGSLDVGLFSYDRPALSVSGCCHLLPMREIEVCGGFDIRFSPTQFDDLERDLRCALAGHPAFYAGTLAVRHVQHSSLAKAKDLAAIGHIFGNRIKLESLFSAEDMARLAAWNLDRLWAHLECVFKAIDGD